MKQIQKILFPVDFSESSEKYIPWLVTFAKQFDATVYLISVTPDVSGFASFYAPHANIKGFQDEIKEGAAKKMKEFIARHLKDLPKVETRMPTGRAEEKILEVARQEQIDLIIMGSHGRSGLERTIFGSVAEKVIKNAPCPVLTIRPV
ncbi:MAG: universal stress protein [Desulfobacca sp.]|nr:universal stress protein [Desulfobacca sp.]